MTHGVGVLALLYERLDNAATTAEERAKIIGMFAPDFAWEFSLPDRVASGDIEAFEASLVARAGTARRAQHQIIASTRSGSIEMIMGALKIASSPPSPFIVAAELNDGGLITRLLLRRTTALAFAQPDDEKEPEAFDAPPARGDETA